MCCTRSLQCPLGCCSVGEALAELWLRFRRYCSQSYSKDTIETRRQHPQRSHMLEWGRHRVVQQVGQGRFGRSHSRSRNVTQPWCTLSPASFGLEGLQWVVRCAFLSVSLPHASQRFATPRHTSPRHTSPRLAKPFATPPYTFDFASDLTHLLTSPTLDPATVVRMLDFRLPTPCNLLCS